jgi:hypothetical protein
LIRDDVRYTGEWGELFSGFETFDRGLVTSYIRHIADQPRWHWWETLQHPSKTIPRERLVRSFNVIYIASRSAAGSWLPAARLRRRRRIHRARILEPRLHARQLRAV